ncbi:MAG: hypothetical protein F6J90_38305 [Moorea sp. SIOASIH]|uniref:hypothetical protein n=1 Tax=Moorena sp. SIOASIH TaxID=2607817 RepID=UPI0013BA03B2|nr:hypothetical protein [Moorena sp. SIOASIH]NEO41865.1 hypothetical protein [Moorena sp. SIOASIH]
MANININDLSALNLTGAELFNDSESFMMEVNEDSEAILIIGGQNESCCLCSHTCGKTLNAQFEMQFDMQ